MFQPNRKHPQSVHFHISSFVFQFISIVFEVSYLVDAFFPKLSRKHFSVGKEGVEYHSPPSERISRKKAGHDLIAQNAFEGRPFSVSKC